MLDPPRAGKYQISESEREKEQENGSRDLFYFLFFL